MGKIRQSIIIAALHHKMAVDDLVRKPDTRRVRQAKRFASLLPKLAADASYQQIGDRLGRHHTTILSNQRMMRRDMEENPRLHDEMMALAHAIRSGNGHRMIVGPGPAQRLVYERRLAEAMASWRQSKSEN